MCPCQNPANPCWCCRYSNKAAKYAAMALKAQAAKKVPVLQPQMQVQVQGAPVAGQPATAAAQGDASKPTLANFAANLLKKKPAAAAADKASTLTAPKPSLKMQKAADAELQATAEEFTADEEVSWEDYMANPQLYAGGVSGVSFKDFQGFKKDSNKECQWSGRPPHA